MKITRWQFSLRQLLLLMTALAVVMTLVSHQWRFVIGLVTVLAVFLEAFGPIVEMLVVFLNPRNWRRLPERKPTAGEIQELAEKFAARYPKQPQATINSGDQPDSR